MNLTRILKLANGQDDFVKHILLKYPLLLESSIEELNNELIKSDKDKLTHVIHKLKPNLDLIESNNAYELSILLLEKLKKGTYNDEDFDSQLTEFISQIIHLNEQVKSWITENY